MPTTSTTTERPRIDGDRETEILGRVVELLIEVGYDKLSFDLVATAARASKATLYRYWPTKVDLVIAALTTSECQVSNEYHDTGSLAGDIAALACTTADPMTTQVSCVIASIVPALHRDPELTARFQESFVAPRARRLREVLKQAQKRGEVSETADIEMLCSILPSMAMGETIRSGGSPSLEYMQRVIDEVFLPAARAAD